MGANDLVERLDEDLVVATDLVTRATALEGLTYLLALDKEMTWPTN